MTENSDDSAGKKGGLHVESAFFVVAFPKIGFTGVGYVTTLHQMRHMQAKALTWF